MFGVYFGRYLQDVGVITKEQYEDMETLIEMGYQAVSKVEHSLQFASRGDILDIYSVSELDPIRIEFFDDEIEDIKLFDVQSQESKERRNACTILPATDAASPPFSMRRAKTAPNKNTG